VGDLRDESRSFANREADGFNRQVAATSAGAVDGAEASPLRPEPRREQPAGREVTSHDETR
jgi:hypothetical protein